MFKEDMFPSRFFTFDDAIKHEELMKVLNAIKKDTDNLAVVATGHGGPTYKTNYTYKEIHGKLFNPIVEHLNKLLAANQVSFEVEGSPWYAEYGEYDFHEPHIHSETCIMTERGNSFRYSGVICLSDFGETTFIN